MNDGKDSGPWSARSATQPGGRPQAPDGLSLVQAFINSHYDLETDHGADLFATPAGLSNWMRAHGLLSGAGRLRAEDLRRALAVREGLRELARANAGDGRGNADDGVDHKKLDELNTAAAGAAAEVRLTLAGSNVTLIRGGGVSAALGVVLALTAQAMAQGTWRRLKVCPADDCGWAFYDNSRNQTARWCSMSVCGGRAKARAHYARTRRRG